MDGHRFFYVGRNLVAAAGRSEAISWDRAVLFELIYW
jgi:hypothetical protein